MPEGDTIHHAAARIRAVLEGRVPDQILTPQPRHRADRWPQRLRGRAVRSAGIGNVWKAELCFAAGIDPWRALAKLGDDEAIGLIKLARELMLRSARDGFGARPRAVYKRAGLPCPRCKTIICQHGQGENNRFTFWCPGCQS
jgi:formamidopyrimidine-DNA glycosylase